MDTQKHTYIHTHTNKVLRAGSNWVGHTSKKSVDSSGMCENVKCKLKNILSHYCWTLTNIFVYTSLLCNWEYYIHNCDPSVQNQSHVAENINWVFHMCRKRRRWALIWCKNIYFWQLVKKLCSFECTQYLKCKCQKSRFKVFIYYYWNDYLLLNTAFLVYLNTYFMCDTWPYDS